jgi:acylphosphatase
MPINKVLIYYYIRIHVTRDVLFARILFTSKGKEVCARAPRAPAGGGRPLHPCFSASLYPHDEVYAIIEAMDQSDEQQNEELYAVVRGRVQGVGFRYFVIEEAQALGLRGYVRNEGNGDVEVLAQGPRPALERLLTLLRRGPSAARVYDVRTEWREPTLHISGFHIRY